MITAIEIENFKAFGKRQRIELKPITLLFGPNSAGKSTIIQALHYAYEVLVNRNLDVGSTTLGGDYIDLGGFANLVYGHDWSQSIRLRFHLNLAERDWPRYSEFYLRHDAELEGVESRVRDTDTAWVELAIRWNERDNAPYVAEYMVGLDGQPLATFKNFGVKVSTYIADVNIAHPHFALPDKINAGLEVIDWSAGQTPESLVRVELVDALPQFDEVPVITPDDSRIQDDELGSGDNPFSLPHSLLNILAMAMAGPGRLLRDELARHFRYVGPLRQKPERGRRAPSHPAPGDWASGVAAWDSLHSAPVKTVENVSEWMASEKKLDSGYEVKVRRYRELDEFSSLFAELTSERPVADLDFLAIRSQLRSLPLRTEVFLVETKTGLTVLPHDVGEGIAQVLPVVVAVMPGAPATAPSITAIEQPELHVHPRIQVEIGELFIHWKWFWYNALAPALDHKPSRALLIETHSEHLLLRLLHRIRDTQPDAPLMVEYGLKPSELAVLYVSAGPDGAIVEELRVNTEGDFVDQWPDGFFEERGEELFG